MKARRLLPLAGIVLALLGGCEFLGWDVYPPELQNLDASLDLDKLLYSQTGEGLGQVKGSAVLRLDSSSDYHLLILCSTDTPGSPDRVLFLNPKTLAFESIVTSYSACLPLTMIYDDVFTAMFCAGLSRIKADLTEDLTIQALTKDSVGVVPDAANNRNLVLNSNGGILLLSYYSPTWTAPGSFSHPIDLYIPNIQLVAIRADDEDSKVRLLFRDPYTGSGFLLNFASPNDLYLAAQDTDLSTSTHVASRIDLPSLGENATITKAGVISQSWNDNGSLRRYSLVSGSVLDSKAFNEDGTSSSGLSFSPDGSRWYYYDATRALFLALRTWW